MRPTTVRLSAAGFSPWIPVNRLQANFNVGIVVYLSSGASLTYSVQHTMDNLYDIQPCAITRSTTVATLKQTNHGLSVADWIQVFSAGDANLNGSSSGNAVASVVDANNITYTVSNTGATADTGFSTVSKARVLDNLTLTGMTVRGDGNYVNPITAVRLKITSYSSGFADMNVIQGLGA